MAKSIRKIKTNDGLACHVGTGLGKTRSTLLALEKILKRDGYDRVLVVGPIPVVESTWPAEIKKWGFDMTYQLIRSKNQKKRVDQLSEEADIFAINFEALTWLSNPKHDWFWNTLDVLVIDELTKCKSTKSSTYRILRKKRSEFKLRVGLTGTMLPENYVGLFGQFTSLTGEIWQTKRNFIQSNFANVSVDPRYPIYKALPGAKKRIRKQIKSRMITLSTEDYLDIPDYSVQDYYFDLPPSVMKHYKAAEKKLFLELGSDEYSVSNLLGEDIDYSVDGDVAMDDTSAMRIKLRQIVSGFLYKDGQVLTFDRTKLDYALSIRREHDENVLMGYQLTQERDQLLTELDSTLIKGNDAIDAWDNNEIRHGVFHPRSVGHGVNLQHGGRVLMWYSLPRSYEQYSQSNARLYRTGQKFAVVIARIIARGTIDEVIVENLKEKENEQNQFRDSLK